MFEHVKKVKKKKKKKERWTNLRTSPICHKLDLDEGISFCLKMDLNRPICTNHDP